MATVRVASPSKARLQVGMAQAFAELDKADGTRIGLQESIDAAQAVLRDAYGETLDNDALQYMEDADEDDFDDDDEDDFDEDDE